MRKLVMILLTGALVLGLTACKNTKAPAPSSSPSQTSSAQTGDEDDWAKWETVTGSFAWDESSQYTNKVLQMKYLSNGCVMFEFRLMEGSESNDTAEELILPGILVVGDDGIGRYETLPDSENPYGIEVALSDDGQSADVTHTGEIDISPDGTYTLTDESLEVSEVSAITILEHLPTAATSLNHNNGEYVIHYPDALVANWFYPVEATFADSGAVIAKFLIAKDMSAVYRADDDIEPALIFGTAQPMMDYEIIPVHNEANVEDEEIAEPSYEPEPIVYAELADGVNLTVGQVSQVTVVLPWELPYTLTCATADTDVIEADESGAVRALAPGEAVISCSITVDDGYKEFSIEVSVSAN